MCSPRDRGRVIVGEKTHRFGADAVLMQASDCPYRVVQGKRTTNNPTITSEIDSGAGYYLAVLVPRSALLSSPLSFPSTTNTTRGSSFDSSLDSTLSKQNQNSTIAPASVITQSSRRFPIFSTRECSSHAGCAGCLFSRLTRPASSLYPQSKVVGLICDRSHHP